MVQAGPYSCSSSLHVEVHKDIHHCSYYVEWNLQQPPAGELQFVIGETFEVGAERGPLHKQENEHEDEVTSYYYKDVEFEDVSKDGENGNTRDQHAQVPQDLGYVSWQNDASTFTGHAIV